MAQNDHELIKVLVVDDDPEICLALKQLFRKRGYFVATVGSGGEALEQMKETLYHFAIIDVRLPDMTGVELLDEIRKTNYKTNCIMMTGHKDEGAETDPEVVAKAHLMKPLRVEDVIRIFDTGLEGKK